MARKLRIEFPGAIYHLMSQGDRREEIFKDDLDRSCFIDTLGQACGKTGWFIHAYCLLPDHFHLVLETPQPNLVAGMKWLLGTYTARFNKRHKLTGHLFSGRYKSLLIDGKAPGYLLSVCDYVHLNPARAGLLAPAQPLLEYRWSSYPQYMKQPLYRPPWLKANRLLAELNISSDTPAGRERLRQHLESRRRQGTDSPAWRELRHNWYLGGAAFREELLVQVNQRRGVHHYGEELRAGDLERAERILKEALARQHWTEEELGLRAKTDPEKARLAMQLRRETTMTLAWITQRLHMGSLNTLKNTLRKESGAS